MKMGRPRIREPGEPRSRAIHIDSETFFRESWVARVQRGRTCQMCDAEIPAGRMSLRYIRKFQHFDRKKGSRYEINSEKSICPKCAILGMEKQIAKLREPDDKEMFNKIKKNHNSRW